MTRDYERKTGKGQGISAEVIKRAVREINNGKSIINDEGSFPWADAAARLQSQSK